MKHNQRYVKVNASVYFLAPLDGGTPASSSFRPEKPTTKPMKWNGEKGVVLTVQNPQRLLQTFNIHEHSREKKQP